MQNNQKTGRNKILMLILISFMLACTNNAGNNKDRKSPPIETKSNNSANDIVPEKKKVDQTPISQERDIISDRNNAAKELGKSLSDHPKLWKPIVLNYFMVDYLSEGQGPPKDILDLGEWYKFNTDFHYEHGFFDKITDSGKYFVNDKKELLMLPSNKSLAPSEWKILNSGDVIVMVGTSKFGNNPIQKHCQNVSKRPEIETFE